MLSFGVERDTEPAVRLTAANVPYARQQAMSRGGRLSPGQACDGAYRWSSI